MCIHTQIYIHTNLDIHNYTQKCKNTQSTIHIVGLDSNVFLLLGTSREHLTFILREESSLCAPAVLCLLQQAILALSRGSCPTAWACVALYVGRSVIKMKCNCLAGHAAFLSVFFSTSLQAPQSIPGRFFAPLLCSVTHKP